MEFQPTSTKEQVVQKITEHLKEQGFELIDADYSKPWGAYFSINEDQADKFIASYCPGLDRSTLQYDRRLRPKILLIAPGQRLSWQYHSRRAEVWRAVAGPFAVIRSETNQETEPQILYPGDTVIFLQGQRHRGAGLENWGVVAEIWQHVDPANPSDEADIVHVQDDYAR